MKGAFKSFFGVPSGSSGGGSGTSGWEDFSTFSNTPPIASDARSAPMPPPERLDEDVHPLTRDWADRINNRNVRAAFLQEPIDSYTTAHDLRVWTGTWNTNGKPPPPDLDITPWLDVSSRPDLVVVGFQEIVPLTPGKVLMQEDANATGEWEAIIERALNGTVAAGEAKKAAAASAAIVSAAPASAPATSSPSTFAWASFGDGPPSGGAGEGQWASFNPPSASPPRSPPPASSSGGDRPSYVRLARKQLVGVYITVWATIDAASHARDVRVDTVSTGVNLGVSVLGNKGGAGVWLKMYATPLVFICSHLSAGSKEGDEAKRSEDYGEIASKLSFPAPLVASSDGTAERAATVGDAFAAIWIGDLNYRLNLPDDVVRSAVAAGAHASLLGSDQLVLEQAAGRAFRGWTEAPVTFPPTYKYRPGTNTYSGSGDVGGEDGDAGGEEGGVKVSAKEEKKKRTPAWCDRILWRGKDVAQESYDAVSALTASDHKPVRATFRVTARELMPERYRRRFRRRVGGWTRRRWPQPLRTRREADFGDCAATKSTTFRLVNTGASPRRGDSCRAGATAAPPWISLSPRATPTGRGVEIAAVACVRAGRPGTRGAAGAASAAAGATSSVTASGGVEWRRVWRRVWRQPRPPLRPTRAVPVRDGVRGAGSTVAAVGDFDARPGASAAGPSPRRAFAQARAASSGIARAADRGACLSLRRRPSTRRGGVARGGGAAGAVAGVANSLGRGHPRPVDAILVLHLEGGRDFFLTVGGTLAPTVFGRALGSLPSASFPPGVPAPVATLVDALFERGVRVPGVFRPPARGTLAGLAAIRAALDDAWTGGAAGPRQPPGRGLPRGRVRAPRAVRRDAATALRCGTGANDNATASAAAAVDAMMTPWAAAAVAAARAAAPGTPWTLAAPEVAGKLPAMRAVDDALRARLPAAERATLTHACALVRAALAEVREVRDGGERGAAARILAQFAEVWFPRATGANEAATRMGRMAMLGVLCGAHPAFLDGFDPMERTYVRETGEPAASATVSGGFAAGVGGGGFAPSAEVGGGGNLIDF